MTDASIPLTEQDEADLAELHAEPAAPQPRSVLEIWREVLSNVDASAREKVTPQNAVRLVSVWPKLSFQDLADYHGQYHSFLKEMRSVLHEVIAENPDCLKNVGDDDVKENRGAYLEILFRWQAKIIDWEHEWDTTRKDSHITIAALADAGSFFLDQQGLVAHLESIQLDMTEEESENLGTALTEYRDSL